MLGSGDGTCRRNSGCTWHVGGRPGTSAHWICRGRRQPHIAIHHSDGTLLGVGHNRLVQEGNGSLHGETDAFRAAGRRPTWHDTILVTTLAPCWYCSGLIYQFRFRQVIVGDSVNAQGGMHWLREKGIDIVDLHSEECIDLIARFQRLRPDLWKECIGEA